MLEPIPVLLDTDIGSDIDDALALAYLLCQPRCDLLGVTTVTGEVQQRAALVEVLCQAAGRAEVPVHCGTSKPLWDGPGQPDVPQYEAIRHLAHRLDRPPATAVEFLRRTIRERPGEVTLLSVGPLTNVALLFALDPEIPSLLGAWVSMAGDFPAARSADWNCYCDPLAAALAYAAPISRSLHAGIDVTNLIRMPAPEVRRRLRGTPLLDLIREMAEVWFSTARQDMGFHDPLAAALIFEPDLCSYHRGSVRADPATGRTSFDQSEGSALVAFEVDAERFFREFFAVLGR